MAKILLLAVIIGTIYLYPLPVGVSKADFEPGLTGQPAEVGPEFGSRAAIVTVSPTVIAAGQGSYRTSSVQTALGETVQLTIAAPQAAPLKTRKAWVTAYSSAPEETDDTPFITACGTTVRHGIVAANFVPFDTRIQIPALFGDRVFVVEDRMHERKTNGVDVWMPSKEEAKQFGANYTDIVILD